MTGLPRRDFSPGLTPAPHPTRTVEKEHRTSTLPATVVESWRYVVRADKHAATRSLAVVRAPSGSLLDEATFPTTPSGVRRARDWIGRHTDSEGDLNLVLTAAEGTGSYDAAIGNVLEKVGYRAVEAPTARRERNRGKTDALDALPGRTADLRDVGDDAARTACTSGARGTAGAHGGP